MMGASFHFRGMRLSVWKATLFIGSEEFFLNIGETYREKEGVIGLIPHPAVS